MDMQDKKISVASIDEFNKSAALAVQVFVNSMLWQVIQFCEVNDISLQAEAINKRIAELKDFMNARMFLSEEIFKEQGAEIVEDKPC